MGADEVFLASTVREVQPVAAVNERSFAQSGPVTERTASQVIAAIQSELRS
jgi:branched-subunit amino acid aminotransferase/4-amino-4-deoxychorismate lyase